jgi:hypothetical protein
MFFPYVINIVQAFSFSPLSRKFTIYEPELTEKQVSGGSWQFPARCRLPAACWF